MTTSPAGYGIRQQYRIQLSDFDKDRSISRSLHRSGRFLEAVDVYEQLVAAYPNRSIEILAELYEIYRTRRHKGRYHLYQSRHFNFGIQPGDKVLDIGSGHIPLPLATHLSDITLHDHRYGRAGKPFKHIQGKPVYECRVEDLPFEENQFDFVYCSHVLEHADDIDGACRELMRVAKRGFIECPTAGKDLLLNSAKVSQHRWGVSLFENTLVFSEYTEEEVEGVQNGILMDMHCDPQSEREKAFSALVYLKADRFNTMLLWDRTFDYEIKMLSGSASRIPGLAKTSVPHGNGPAAASEHDVDPNGAANAFVSAMAPEKRTDGQRPLRFMQIHTFYEHYLVDFYRQHPHLKQATYSEQLDHLVQDGFSGIHMFAPYMAPLGYKGQLIIANNPISQRAWLDEHGGTTPERSENSIYEIVQRQIEAFKPDVLYLSDPIGFDDRFLARLDHRPALVMGWRAASIPNHTSWRGFDLMLSSLPGIRDAALKLGARSAEHFFPGYPEWINEVIADVHPRYDVVFSGQWSEVIHKNRNRYLQYLAQTAGNEFSLALYLSGQVQNLPPEVGAFNQGARYGVAMHRALRTGRMVIDARGKLETHQTVAKGFIDLAGRHTANMRIFEATGAGVFLLAEQHDNLKEYFVPGEEIETFTDTKDLGDKIRYYCEHDDERQAIAERGQARCLRDYTMQKRATALDGIIRRHLPAARWETTASKDCTETVCRNAIAEATAHIEANRFQDAFELINDLKASGRSMEGVDVVRAKCFLAMGQAVAAREALKEELRYFPDNQEAAQLLKRVAAIDAADKPNGHMEAEFGWLLSMVADHTMLSVQRLYSLYRQARRVCENNIPGNFVECGVAAGGSSAVLAYVIKRYSRTPRRLFAFDTFSGMPRPTEADTAAGMPAQATGWGKGTCAAPVQSVKDICKRIGASEMLLPVEGKFEHTLPAWRDKVGMVALLHLDGDWYASTRTILDALFDRVVARGILQIDDYGHWDGCRRAVHEFEADRKLKFALNRIDGTGVWCVKNTPAPINPDLSSQIVTAYRQLESRVPDIPIQMSPNERFQLFYTVKELVPMNANTVRFIEIGSYQGGSLMHLDLAFKNKGCDLEGLCIDPARHASLVAVVKRLGDHITYLPVFSHQALPKVKRWVADGGRPSLIFLDGDHGYEGVRQDIIDYYPLLAPGGILLLHDWLPELNDQNREAIMYHHAGSEPGVRRACEEVLEGTFGLKPISLPLLYTDDPTQTQAHLPIIPEVFSTVRAYQKPGETESVSVSKMPVGEPGRPNHVSTIRSAGPPNILHLSTLDFGGAGIAAYRLHQGMVSIGLPSRMCTLSSTSGGRHVSVVDVFKEGRSGRVKLPMWTLMQQHWHTVLDAFPKRSPTLCFFSTPESFVSLDTLPALKEADVVNLHWVAGLVDIARMADSFAGKHLVWTLHDMNAFTGGCHYAGDCLRYVEGCYRCPQLGEGAEDLARSQWRLKSESYNRLDMTIVTPSRWLGECSRNSALLGRFPHEVIPYGLPFEDYHPEDATASRAELGLPQNKVIVMFGASAIRDHRKGFDLFSAALERLAQSAERPAIAVAAFGDTRGMQRVDLPFPMKMLGHLDTKKKLRLAFSAADAFVLPSREDNLPNTMLESLACGTPVVGFDIGGIPDLVKHKHNGYLAHFPSASDLAGGILWAVQRAGEKRLVETCRETALSHFPLDVQAQRYLKVYERLGNSLMDEDIVGSAVGAAIGSGLD
jgi:glycosyltransferase involved in cell wall biosynthesis/SAM-dependent methyltransferase/predicted O-methyltransferase YrrM